MSEIGSSTVQGGARANRAGRRLEGMVGAILQDRGYRRVNAKEFPPAASGVDAGFKELHQTTGGAEAVYAEQFYIGQSIYGKKRKVDFVLYHPKMHRERLVIQCKWQSSGGSVDEKYPYEVECINDGGVDTIIVLDGDGYSQGAHDWLLRQTHQHTHGGHLLAVVNIGGFERLAKDGKL